VGRRKRKQSLLIAKVSNDELNGYAWDCVGQEDEFRATLWKHGRGNAKPRCRVIENIGLTGCVMSKKHDITCS
jgi:hypothetical protein